MRDDKVTIVCPIHGEFKQRVEGHFNCGCEKCARDADKLNTQEFISRAIKIHGDRYDYSKVLYINNYTKVDILCRKHGLFQQLPYDHCRGSGCPKCKIKHGERLICLILENNNILYSREYKIEDSPYRYDFHITDTNILIEYDGQIHKNPPKHYGLNWNSYIKTLDNAKDKLAKDKNYSLLRIDYLDYRKMEKIICDYITRKYPYRFDNKLYEDIESLNKDIKLEVNAITPNLDNYKIEKQWKSLSFSVTLKHNIKKIN